MTAQQPTPRVLIIGLDGATFGLLDPMTAQGWMPNLQRALDGGSRGILHSTLPPLTAPAWSSFLTGMSPGHHGVFSFQKRGMPGQERAFVDSRNIQTPRIWHWLALHGMTMGAINIPMTWPPQPMPSGSYVVAGMLTPSTDVPFTDPPELASMLRAMNYVCDLRVKLNELDTRSSAGLRAIARDLKQVLLRRESALFALQKAYPTDVLAVVFEAPDRLQHWTWRVLEEALYNDGSLNRTDLHQAVEDCYRELDRVIGRLLDEVATADTHVFFLSDHGFGPLRSRFHVDSWLAQRGWLRYASGRASLRQRLRQPMQRVKHLVPRALLRQGRRALAVSQLINWDQTRAYSGRAMEHAININLRGRDPQGTVAPEQFDVVRQNIAQALMELRDPATGLPLVEAAYLREELYQGPRVEEAPDLLFKLAPGYEPTSELTRQGWLSDVLAEGAGIHQPDGIFIALGPGIRKGNRLGGHHIEDLLPTVLYALDLPIATTLDGRIIKTAFSADYLAQHPPMYSADTEPAFKLRADTLTASSDKMAERLSALGYLD